MAIALSALDSGRLGIAACATGLAQGALDLAVGYAKERQQFGQPIGEFQGLQFLLADMAAAVESARATYLLRGPAAGRRPAVQPAGVGREAGGDRRGDAGDDRRRPGARRLRLHARLPGRALHARGQGDADLRGHQPDPADGHRPEPAARAARRRREQRRRRLVRRPRARARRQLGVVARGLEDVDLLRRPAPTGTSGARGSRGRSRPASTGCALLGRRHPHDRLEDLGQPPVRDHRRVLALQARGRRERVEVVEQPTRLVLLDVEPGEPLQPTVVVARRRRPWAGSARSRRPSR